MTDNNQNYWTCAECGAANLIETAIDTVQHPKLQQNLEERVRAEFSEEMASLKRKNPNSRN